jgi:hypothetical protein
MAIGEALEYRVEELTGPPAAIIAAEKLRAAEKKRREKSLLPA